MSATSSPTRRTLLERFNQPGFWSFAAAIILSVATLATAWSSYQAASWGDEAAVANRSGTAARFEATRQGDIADRQVQTDLLIFATWLEAETLGNDALAQAVQERFRADFATAFTVWRGVGKPGVLPPGSPFDLPDYAPAGWQEEERLNQLAVDFAAEADAASAISNNYVLSAVLYASVMFLAGIAVKLATRRGRRLLIATSGLALLATLVATLVTPIDVNL